MLYDLHEARRAWLDPIATMAGASARALQTKPLSKLPFTRRVAATNELWHRLAKDYPKPAFDLGVDERAVLDLPFCRLVHFERAAREGDAPRVLVVAPLSGHHATLLRDTVRALLPEHDVYLTDWIDARMVPLSHGSFGLDDYVDYVKRFLRELGEATHVVSVCQPAVPVLGAVSLLASEGAAHLPRSMTLMGGPIDARKNPTEVSRFALKKPLSWFDETIVTSVPSRYPGHLRRVYPGFMQLGAFVAMNPAKHWRAHRDFVRAVVRGDQERADAHRRFYDDYNAVLDMPAEFYLDTVSIVFQEHRLPRGAWRVRGQLVAPRAIESVALFTIEGEKDDIVGAGQTHAAHDLCTSIPEEKRQRFTAKGCGHYGIFSGRRWREEIHPRVRDFIRAHDVPARDARHHSEGESR